jgi:hypothetical protein
MVPETSVSSCNHLTQLCAREDFIEDVTALTYDWISYSLFVRIGGRLPENIPLNYGTDYVIWLHICVASVLNVQLETGNRDKLPELSM